MTKPPAREQAQVNIRMPDELRDRIKAKAESNERSMNAEIVDALQTFYPRPKRATDVVEEVVSVLSFVEPGLREQAIQLLREKAESGSLGSMAEAYAYAERDMHYRFPWED